MRSESAKYPRSESKTRGLQSVLGSSREGWFDSFPGHPTTVLLPIVLLNWSQLNVSLAADRKGGGTLKFLMHFNGHIKGIRKEGGAPCLLWGEALCIRDWNSYQHCLGLHIKLVSWYHGWINGSMQEWSQEYVDVCQSKRYCVHN